MNNEKKNMKWLQTASLMQSKCAKRSSSNTVTLINVPVRPAGPVEPFFPGGPSQPFSPGDPGGPEVDKHQVTDGPTPQSAISSC